MKTSVEVDRDIAAQAADVLGTTTLCDTIDASLREIVNARRRLEAVALLAEEGRSDFEDALQVAAARACGAQRIVTRNLKDYKHSPIPAVSPQEALSELT